jgi:hypothetical protein
VLSHDYPLSGWIPEKYVQMDLEDKVKISGVTTTLIYLYVVPAKVEGRWAARTPGGPMALSLRQQITRVTGTARLKGRDVPLEDVKLRGERISFRVAGSEFSGRVEGAAMHGEGGAWSAERAK